MINEESNWTLEEAIKLITLLEGVASQHGYHVALTGGLLYRHSATRKDLDIVMYEVRQGQQDREALRSQIGGFLKLEPNPNENGIHIFGWMEKWMTSSGQKIDIMFPDTPKTDEDGCYPEAKTLKEKLFSPPKSAACHEKNSS